MPGTVVLVHHDLVVVIDPDVLIRRSVVAALNGLGLYGLAYGGWRDAARQLARIAPKLRAMPLPASINSFDCLDLWQRLSSVLGTSHRSLSVLPVTSMSGQHQVSAGLSSHPVQLVARQLREAFHVRRSRQHQLAADDKPAVSVAEDRVLSLVREGKSNKRIASELCLSQRTVESHLHRLFRKLEVKNRTELALAAA